LLNERARSYYKNINKNAISLVNLLTSENLSLSLQNFFYQKTIVDQDRNAITKIVRYIKDLETKKEELIIENKSLAKINEEIDRQSKVLSGEIAQTKQKINDLSARQQDLINAKLASVPIPRSAETSLSGCSSDLGKSPGFGKAFGFFSFGVPNKIGLNQYGAKGRADAGESNEENILRAYYNFDNIGSSSNISIRVDGYETYNLEDYLKGIHEMPTSFPATALKAQAIAARSYVLAYTNNGAGSICASENCQVFRPEPDRNDAWTQAVKDTEGKVMIQGGNPIKAWFSSTHGGFILSSGEIGWSSTSWTKHNTDAGSGGNISDLKSTAYDKDSPWFYCDWGYRSENNNTAWLKENEVVDIVNAYILWELDNSMISHLSQTDKPSGDTWSESKVVEEINKKGGSAISSISSISVGWDGSGISRTISVSGRNFDAQKFKNLFNIRAPANIQIKPACRPQTSELNCSMFALYNVETQ